VILLTWLSWKKFWQQLDGAAMRQLLAFISANLIIAIIFLTISFFMVNRYLLLLALTLLLSVPFGLEAAVRNWQQLYTAKAKTIAAQIALIVCVLFLIISSIFHIGADKSYIKQTGLWVKQNIPAQAVIFTNQFRINYYSQHPHHNPFISGTTLTYKDVSKIDKNFYNYFIIQVNQHHITTAKQLFKQINLTIIKQFSNNRHDTIFVLKK
jgi:hypothetical protein